MAHLSEHEIEAVVMGTVELDDPTRVHLRACPDCAARLAREARVEETLRESMLAARFSSARRTGVRGWNVAVTAAAAVAVVAIGVWIAGSSPKRTQPAPPPVLLAPAGVAAPPDQAPGMLDPVGFAPGYSAARIEPCRHPAVLMEMAAP